MSATDGPSADDWVRIAREHASDAHFLANGKRWRSAYMAAGIAVECALKGRIMRRQGMNRWPTRKERPELYSHDLGKLAVLAGMTERLENALASGDPMGIGWMIAKDFSINKRYPTNEPFPVRLGRDMVASTAGKNGLVEWLIKGTP